MMLKKGQLNNTNITMNGISNLITVFINLSINWNRFLVNVADHPCAAGPSCISSWYCKWVIEVRLLIIFLTPLYFAEYGGYGGGGGGGGGYGAQSYSVPPPASGAPPAGGYTAPAAAYDQSQYAQWGQGVY